MRFQKRAEVVVRNHSEHSRLAKRRDEQLPKHGSERRFSSTESVDRDSGARRQLQAGPRREAVRQARGDCRDTTSERNAPRQISAKAADDRTEGAWTILRADGVAADGHP